MQRLVPAALAAMTLIAAPALADKLPLPKAAYSADVVFYAKGREFTGHINVDGPKERRQAKNAAGVERPHHVVLAQAGNRARESSKGRGRIIQPEIDDPTLGGNEWLNSVSTEIDARPKQTVNHPQISALKGYRAGGIVSETFGEGFAEIVGHFSFQLQALVGHERGAAADA